MAVSLVVMVLFIMQSSIVLAVPTAITKLKGNPKSSEIYLTWTKGSGNQTMVRYKTTDYPANTADGTLVYQGTLNYASLTGLTAGARYYFSAWSYDGGSYSVTAAQLVTSTLLSYGLEVGDTLTMPSVSARFLQAIDHTNLSKFEPFYSITNNFLTGFNVPVNYGWEAIALIVVTAMSLWAYTKRHEIFIGVGVMFLGFCFTTMIELTPGWFILIPIVVGAGAWGLERAYQ